MLYSLSRRECAESVFSCCRLGGPTEFSKSISRTSESTPNIPAIFYTSSAPDIHIKFSSNDRGEVTETESMTESPFGSERAAIACDASRRGPKQTTIQSPRTQKTSSTSTPHKHLTGEPCGDTNITLRRTRNLVHGIVPSSLPPCFPFYFHSCHLPWMSRCGLPDGRCTLCPRRPDRITVAHGL